MKNTTLYIGFLLLIGTLPFPAWGRPVGWADSWSVMTRNDREANSLHLMYTLTPNDAFGVEAEYERGTHALVQGAMYNRLIQRWNMPEAQANIFLTSMLGVAEDDGLVEPAGAIGVQSDFETRRIYTLYSNRYLYADEIERSFSQIARVGVAPYLGEYQELNTWLILELQHQPSEDHNVVLSPILRFYFKNYLWETGVSNQGDLQINFAATF